MTPFRDPLYRPPWDRFDTAVVIIAIVAITMVVLFNL